MDDAKIVGYKTENNRDHESSKQDCLLEILTRQVKPRGVLPTTTSTKKLQISDFCTQKLFLQQIKSRIPKQLMSLEEKYLRHCLESIHMNAMNFFPNSRMVDRSGCDALFLFSSTDENLVISTSSVEPIVGSITASTSMINLLNSPLLSPLKLKESLTSVKSSSQELKERHAFVSESVHQRLVSISSTNSTFSVPSSSSSSSSTSSSNSYSQGMLHCSWNNGFPRYVFSVEDQKDVYYTTNLSKVESIKDEGLDYVYMFHDNELDLAAKMKVSTSFTFCPLGTEIMETQFILCATGHHGEEGPTSTSTSNHQIVKKSKGLSKKVTSIFRGHPSRNRTYSKIDGANAMPMLEATSELGNVIPESSFPANLESIAIVVKDHIVKKVEVGGWGLKFLTEGGDRQMHSAACEVCRENSSQQCSSMDVIVPAGFHGGAKAENGGPSGLVERWRNGGSCDCGGWDIGCPLTVLNAGPNNNNKDVLYKAGVFGKSNSFELFTQGCKQSLPVIEVTNIHDGLYYIHYQSTLSALQSLSIAVAIIHSHSPTLKPKVYRPI